MVTYAGPTGSPAGLADLGYDGTTWDKPWNLPRGQLTTLERMPTAILSAGSTVPLPTGESLDVEGLTFTDPLTSSAMTGAAFLDRRVFCDALIVVRDGRILFETYRNGMTEHDRHIVHSCSKTLTTTMIGIAADEGMLSLEQPMTELVPELAQIAAWDGVLLQHVLDMAAGLDTEEHYERPDSMYWRYADAVGYFTVPEEQQIGALAFVQRELVRRLEAPGSRFNYASYLTNLLPLCLANAYGVPAVDLYEDRIYRHLGAEQPALLNVDRLGCPIVEGQVNVTLRDFVRWGHVFAAEGRSLDGRQVVPAAWVEETFRPDEQRQAAFSRGDYADAFPGAEYHNQAWVLQPGRTLAMLGIHGQYCLVDRQTQTLVVGFSSYPDPANPLMIATLQELWDTILKEL